MAKSPSVDARLGRCGESARHHAFATRRHTYSPPGSRAFKMRVGHAWVCPILRALRTEHEHESALEVAMDNDGAECAVSALL